MPHRVGIIVRTLGRPRFLERALSDIARQVYSDALVVVVNDGGDAERVDAVIEAADRGIAARLRVIHLPVTAGRAGAANAGVRALDTEYVVLHDDDDLWHPEFLLRTVAYLDKHPGHAGVVTRTEIHEEAEQRDGTLTVVGKRPFWGDMSQITLADALRSNHFVPIAHLYRRSVHDEVGHYRDDLVVLEDWEFNLRLLAIHEVGYLDEQPLAFWMHRRSSAGAESTSMTSLAEAHRITDARLRDEKLREFIAAYGLGLPLHLARQLDRAFDEQRSRAGLFRRAVRAARRLVQSPRNAVRWAREE